MREVLHKVGHSGHPRSFCQLSQQGQEQLPEMLKLFKQNTTTIAMLRDAVMNENDSRSPARSFASGPLYTALRSFAVTIRQLLTPYYWHEILTITFQQRIFTLLVCAHMRCTRVVQPGSFRQNP